jgi:hypothetical protein
VEADIRVVVDLFNLEEGTHTVVPEVLFPEQRGIELRSIQPSVITVEITQVQAITETLTNTLTITDTSQLFQKLGRVAPAASANQLPPVAHLPALTYDPFVAYLARRESI